MAASKQKDWSNLLGTSSKAPTTDVAAQPAQPPVTVLMHTVVGNPANPRPEEDYTDVDPEFAELKASMKEIGQLQPLAVVSRTVYERAKPEAVAQASPKVRKTLREADWVVVTGNRRLAAARQLGWTRIDIRVQDQLGDEDGRIDEAVIIENIHRKNLSKSAEAEYLQVMLERHGSQEEVARRIGKSQVYVSQRLALLKLAPDIREEVDAGTIKVKDARQLAGQTSDHEEQRARVAELKARTAESRPSRARSTPPVQNPVLKPAPESEPPAAAGLVQNRVLNDARPPVPHAPPVPVPMQAAVLDRGLVEPVEAVEERQPKRFPYDNGDDAAYHLIRKMPPEEFKRMLDLCTEHWEKQTAGAS